MGDFWKLGSSLLTTGKSIVGNVHILRTTLTVSAATYRSVTSDVQPNWTFHFFIFFFNIRMFYNEPFAKDTKRQVFLLQGEWDEIWTTRPAPYSTM